MFDVYEMIETFGMTESGAALPVPNDDTLRDAVISEAFDALIAPLHGTALQGEIEPLAHGLAALIFRRRKMADEALTKQTDAIRALVRSNDGSEITDTALTEAQTRADTLRDLRDALDIMAESAARCYEIETSKAFIPTAGSRNSIHAHLTGATFEAKEWLTAHERQEAQKFKVEGIPLAVAGTRDWMDHAKIWDYLDRIQARFWDRYGEPVILYHKGDSKGVDAIAAAWARARNVAQVTFAPNWNAYGKAAGFKAVDQMFTTPKPLGGVIIFGANGIALNLADKAEAKDISVMRIAETPEGEAKGGPIVITGGTAKT